MKIYNTMTRTKEPLTPLETGKIKMYTCGQTVYNDIHMGNARFYVVFDAIRRYLCHKGYDVKFVQNFTDIDDKIIQKANEENCTSDEIAKRYITHTLEDLAALNIKPATVNPLATQEIPEIIALIEQLIEKNFAYENNGTVYYAVNKFANYGKLSRRKVEDLEAGARVDVEAGKRDAADFVLWKPAKPGEPKWQSPWGEGRPGWHIECSAMAKKYLGDEIDIHGGAEDLIFPHHENEIAQTEAVTGREFARYWMHCGILTTDHKKMSKSRGNFFTFREMAEKGFSPEVIRFYFLSGHYRMPMEFNNDVLKAAAYGLQRIKNCRDNLNFALSEPNLSKNAESDETDLNEARKFEGAFFAAMDDDFNTADAITAIFELVKFINIRLANLPKPSEQSLTGFCEMINKFSEILGIPSTQGDTFVVSFETAGSVARGLTDEDVDIDELIQLRQEARAAKNFAESDRIRDELAGMDIVLEDTPDGVRWRRA